jgi:hypothetical protein
MPFEYCEPEQNISITTYKGLYLTTATSSTIPFTDAVKLFTEHVQAVRKDSVSMYSGAAYGATHERADVNVIAMTAAVIDFDNSRTIKDPSTGKDIKLPTDVFTLPEDHFDNLSGLTYFYHSTHSNTVDFPKWRLIIPLERPATLQKWPFVVNGIIELLGGKDPNIDYTCFELSRAFYVPSYPKEHAAAAFSGYSEGKEVVRVR